MTTRTTANGSVVEVVEVSGGSGGQITDDITFQSGVPYFLSGTVFAGVDAGATTTSANEDGTGVVLTFEPGATIYGSGANSGLVIQRGSMIMADGTADQPIVFTSVEELERQSGAAPANPNARSEWLGLIINGFAPINNCDVIIDGVENPVPGSADCQDDGEAGSGVYGGGDAEDDSGVLRYVRVEHAGVFFTEEDQSNGIAFQGVGSDTVVENIQVHNNGDDGVEFFGGTVNAKNVVITGAADDSIDWTDGWTGSLQNVLVIQSEDSSDFAIEGDNRSVTDADLTPRSNPKISNFTFIGAANGEKGIRLREGTGALLVNGVMSNFNAGGFEIGDAPTLSNLLDATIASGAVSPTYDDDAIVVTSNLFNNDPEVVDGPAEGDGATIQAFLGQQDTILNSDDEVVFFDNEFVEFDSSLASTTFVPGIEVVTFPQVYDVTGIGALTDLGYIGAFSPEETVEDNWAAGWTKPGTVFEESDDCPTGTSEEGALDGKVVCALSGVIQSDLTLDRGSSIIYRLRGQVFVGTDGGSEAVNDTNSTQVDLTIDPGVTVFGDSVTDGLVVTRGSKLFANGTAAAPVVFTSGPALRGEITDPDTRAQWLGLSINGKAPINKCDVDPSATGGTAECEDDGEASSGVFGGNVSADSSGSLTYTRVEYAGIFRNEEDQSNGIAFQGVGAGTVVDFIQVHNNGDDGVEFFGGTVNAKHVVITGQGDDAVDWTDGWTGKMQYVIAEHSNGSDYGFEGDSRSSSSPDETPRSTPQIANYTIIGFNEESPGARFREGMGGDFYNGIIANTSKGLDIDDVVDDLLLNGSRAPDGASLTINGLFLDTAENIDEDDDTDATEASDIRSAISNLVEGTNGMTGFSFFGRDTIGVEPGTAETNATAADPSTLDASFFDAAQYLGAVEDADDDWYLGWTIDSTGAVTSAN
ncbi:MAG: hypothetical protein AAF719_04830 [Pseudomonadota bacterium]